MGGGGGELLVQRFRDTALTGGWAGCVGWVCGVWAGWQLQLALPCLAPPIPTPIPPLPGWYQLRHGALAASGRPADREAAGALVRVKCRAVVALATKAAVQCLGPGAVFMGLGLLLLYSGERLG